MYSGRAREGGVYELFLVLSRFLHLAIALEFQFLEAFVADPQLGPCGRVRVDRAPVPLTATIIFVLGLRFRGDLNDAD